MVKQEPETYSWDDFVKDGSTDWSGVRNYQARNNLRAMKAGDKVLFYHSGKGKEVVGLAEVVKAPIRIRLPTIRSGSQSISNQLSLWRLQFNWRRFVTTNVLANSRSFANRNFQ